MTKEQFIKLMEAIKERYYTIERIYDKLDDVFGSVGDLFIDETSMTPIIDVITEIIEDNDKWIEWYVYEKNWGTDERLTVMDNNGNEIPSETLEDLWNLIHTIENEKDNYSNDLHMDGIGFFANPINKGGGTN